MQSSNGVDYAKLNREFRVQKSALTRAINSKDPAKIIATTEKTLGQWDETGMWPDDWSRWQRALDDAYSAARSAYINGRTNVRPDPAAYDIDTIARRARGLS